MSVTTGVNKWGMPSYTDSSSIFGSIMIRRIFLGGDLYSRLRIMALMATDLPEPVVPATSRCGMRLRSITTGWPLMSLPRPRAVDEWISSYSLELSISLRVTSSRLELGISRPMTDLPGITSTTRTLTTDSDLARSLDRLLIWLPFTPGAGCSSKRVITGPGLTATTSTWILKSMSLSSTWRDMASRVASEYLPWDGVGLSSRFSGGKAESAGSSNNGSCFSASARAPVSTLLITGSMRGGGLSRTFFFWLRTSSARSFLTSTDFTY